MAPSVMFICPRMDIVNEQIKNKKSVFFYKSTGPKKPRKTSKHKWDLRVSQDFEWLMTLISSLLLTHIYHMTSEDFAIYTANKDTYLLFSELDSSWSSFTFNVWKRTAWTFCKTSSFVFQRRTNDVRMSKCRDISGHCI